MPSWPDQEVGTVSRRAMMALPKWQRSGGRDFAFYHSHSGFEWEDLETTNKYQEMLCSDFQVGTQVFAQAQWDTVIVRLSLASVLQAYARLRSR